MERERERERGEPTSFPRPPTFLKTGRLWANGHAALLPLPHLGKLTRQTALSLTLSPPPPSQTTLAAQRWRTRGRKCGFLLQEGTALLRPFLSELVRCIKFPPRLRTGRKNKSGANMKRLWQESSYGHACRENLFSSFKRRTCLAKPQTLLASF